MRHRTLISNVAFRVQLVNLCVYNIYRENHTVYNYITECKYFGQKVTFHIS